MIGNNFFLNVKIYIKIHLRHLPAYIVASFVKKLSRLALYAPFSFQEPLLALIQNLLIRHDTLHFLLHRDEPGPNFAYYSFLSYLLSIIQILI